MKQFSSPFGFFNPRILFGFVFCLLTCSASVLAQEHSGIQFGRSYHNDTSPALRDIAAFWPPNEQKGESEAEMREANLNPQLPLPLHVDQPDPVVDRGLLRLLVPDVMPATILNFDGITSICGCAPPDTNGAVGATQYVQMVNLSYEVFDKMTGASVLGPLSISSIWSGFGGVCQNNGNGDPVVLYDKMANRWLISQFAGTSVPTDQCIAISSTSDATGTYHRYGFHLGANFFDYPHLGAWPDAYYQSNNVFNSSGTAFLGPQAFAFDRTSMLAGSAATFVTLGITGGPSEPSFLPADLDGSILPTAGIGNPFVSFPGNLTYKVRLFHADFVTPANTTFNLIGSPPAAPFTQLCPGTRNCVPQLECTARLDGIGDRLMFRLAYRKFGDGHEAVVSNYNVSSSGAAGVRWFELRGVTTTPVVFQESTYQPDTTWRWMGSVALDQSGNMAVGFSASDATIYPQIRYAGRLAGDPINTLGRGEAHMFDGTGCQSGNGSRWGDYSDMTVDPVDDCTFWYTNEYLAATGTAWRTRIANFKFTQCSSTPTAVIVPGAATITSEGCAPPNNVIDPNEMVTVNFCILNGGTGPTTNLIGTLQNTGGVTGASGPQNYGAIPPSDTPVCRSFSFTATGSCGGTLTATIHFQDGATDLGNVTYTFTLGAVHQGPGITENFDGVVAPALPAGWVATNAVGPGPLWVTSMAMPDSAPNDAFIDDPATISDKFLVTPGLAISSGLTQVSFRNFYNLESGFDGGVLEVSSPNINGGAFTDITNAAVGGSFVTGGYNATIGSGFQSPIAGRMAWSGNSGGYVDTLANLGPQVAGHTIKLRFRMASDNSLSGTGWRVDTISISNPFYVCCGGASPSPTPTATATVPPSPTPTATATVPPSPSPSCVPGWSAGPSLPVAAAVRAVGLYFPANGRFYAVGGRSSDTAGNNFMHPFEYNPATNSWVTKAATFPDTNVNNMACGVLTVSGTPRIYCVGGSAGGGTTATARVFSYDPVADTITSLTMADDWPGAPGGTGATILPGGFAVVANKLYIVGGFNINIGSTIQTWQFDPTAAVGSRWLQRADMPIARSYVPTAAINGVIYTGGGTNIVGTTLIDAVDSFKYDPAANTWSTITNIPRATGETRALALNNLMLVLGGGRTPPNPGNEVDIYEPATDTWTRGLPFTNARRNFPADTDGSKIWLAGGYNNAGALINTMEIFRPGTCGTPSPTATVGTPTPTATATAGGSATPTATVAGSASPTATATGSPGGSPAQALNVSTRLRVLTDANVGIGGFIITGAAPKQVLLRGIGPSLSMVGVPNPLADPELELHGPSGFTTVTNDNWMDDPVQKALIMATGLQPSNNLESAIIATLPPGTYTGILKGKNNGIGVGLVEAYDVGQASNSKLGNISTRGFVATGGDIMIAGFILGGNTGTTNIVVRGIGPSLTPLGVPNALANPQLELRNSAGTVIRSNNDWMDDPAQKALIMAAGLAPGNNLESAIYETLAPGQYTALLSGVNNGTGVALVEAYDLSSSGVPTPTATIGGTPAPTATATPTATAGGSPPCTENWDGVAAPALPAGWTATNPDPGDGVMWVTSTNMSDSAPNNAFIPDQDGISDKVLDRTGVNVTGASATLSLRNNYNMEMIGGMFCDGFVLEVSAPNISGGDFLDITDLHVGGSFVTGGYNVTISSNCGGPLAGRMAWSGNSSGYIDTVVSLGPNLAGQTVTFRFRMISDEAVASPGVHIDNLVFTGATCP